MGKKPRTIRHILSYAENIPSRNSHYSTSMPISVLFRNKNAMIIDKPYDVHIDGPYPITIEKLMNLQYPEMSDCQLHEATTTSHNLEKRKLKFCHQLDYSTSGILCLAFTRKECARISTCFQFRTAKKSYLAVVFGHVAQDQHDNINIRTLIGNDFNDERKFKMMIVTDENDTDSIAKADAKWGETACSLVAQGFYKRDGEWIPVTKMLLKPESGRRHQLRLHMKYIGHPILGDATYAEDDKSHRMMLHAWKLDLPVDLNNNEDRPPKFRRPVQSDVVMNFEAPDPFVGELFNWSSLPSKNNVELV